MTGAAILATALLLVVTGCSGSTHSPITLKSGDDVKVLIIDYRGDSADIKGTVTLARDPNTTCLIAQGGGPLVLPRGTKLRGSGNDVVVVAPDGTQYRLGDQISGP